MNLENFEKLAAIHIGTFEVALYASNENYQGLNYLRVYDRQTQILHFDLQVLQCFRQLVIADCPDTCINSSITPKPFSHNYDCLRQIFLFSDDAALIIGLAARPQDSNKLESYSISISDDFCPVILNMHGY
jgi:hypothetical protein